MSSDIVEYLRRNSSTVNSRSLSYTNFVDNANLLKAVASTWKCHLAKMLRGRKQESLERDYKDLCCVGEILGRKCVRRWLLCCESL